MKNKLKYLFILFTIFNTCYAIDKVKVASGEWAPFMYTKDPVKGIMTEICNNAFATQNINVTYGWYPWARSYEFAEKGLYDMTIGWTYNSERANNFLFSNPIFKLETVFFHRKDFNFDWNTVEDLKKYVLGGIVGYTYGKEFDQFAKDGTMKTDFARNELTNLKKLAKGRIQVFPVEKEVANYIIETQLSEKEKESLTYHKKVFRHKNYYMLISKNSPQSKEILDSFNKGLESLIEQGKFKAIEKEEGFENVF